MGGAGSVIPEAAIRGAGLLLLIPVTNDRVVAVAGEWRPGLKGGAAGEAFDTAIVNCVVGNTGLGSKSSLAN